MNAETITLHCASGGSDKVYEIRLEGSENSWYVNFRYGRRVPGPGYQIQGNQGGTKTSSPLTYDGAQQVYEALIRKQINEKGYRVISRTSGTEGVAPVSLKVDFKETIPTMPMLLQEVRDREHALQLCRNPSYCAQEKFDGERRLIEKVPALPPRGANRKGEYVELSADVRASCATILLSTYLLDAEEVGDTLYVFDILSQNGQELTDEPMKSRYERLAGHVGNAGYIRRVRTAFSTEDKLALFHQVEANKGEGLVFKLVAAPYVSGRSKYALKFKFKDQKTLSVVSVSNSKRSVGLGAATDDGIQFVGNLTIPVNYDIPKAGSLVEVEYLYAYPGGSVFQPVYKGPRTDKDEPDTLASLKFKTPRPDDDESDIPDAVPAAEPEPATATA